jgi:polyisoprenoid-binding protein YceI
MRKFIIALALVAVMVAVGIGIYIFVSGGSGQASAEISAEELAVPEASSQALFRIIPEESSVRFTIDEVLRGQPVTVVAETNQVAGDILVDFDNPAASIIGQVRINVRTMRTDSDLRDRAIRGQILQSSRDEYEFAQFTPTALEGLPASVSIGQPFEFTIVGDLKVRDISNEVRFAAVVTPISETRLEGSAQTVVQRGPYNLTIPNVPSVANVSEDVGLFIDFIAQRVD